MSAVMKEQAADADGGDEDRFRILDNLGLELSKRRSEAIEWRANCGIEDQWAEDEEHYEGIDDANRHELKTAWRTKPMGQADPRDRKTAGSSTIFFNITRPYVDAAAARMGDMLFPTDDRGWSLRPTPVPDLVEIAAGKMPQRVKQQVVDAFTLPDGTVDQARVDKTIAEFEEETKGILKIANEKAQRAEKRIEDWHVQGQYHAVGRRQIESTSKLGTGVMKGPIPMRIKQVAFKGGKLVVSDELMPCSVYVDVWNCFPDPAAGESIHDGSFHWERDDISPMRLQRLKGQPGYIAEQIDQCLREGPHEASKEFDPEKGGSAGIVARSRSRMFEIWYGYVNLERDDIEAAGCQCPEDQEIVPACVTMVNNRVIKAALNVLDTGEFPYDYMVWQRMSGLPFGIGVSRQVRPAQRVVNAAFRAMLTNAGLAAGPMWIVREGMVSPLEGKAEIAPLKGWGVAEDADIDDVAKAFTFIKMDMLVEELQAIIMLGLKMAEDVTGMPMLMQGQMGQTSPDTLGGMQMLNNNAAAPLRRIARLYDDLVTEPSIRRYYAYLMQYGDDREKGDFQVDARGSTTLVERDLNNQVILALAQFVVNPIFGKDPKKWINEWLKSQRLDPARFDYTDEEWKELVEKMAASAQKGDSSVEVAQIRAQLEQWKTEKGAEEKAKDREFEIAKLALSEQYDEAERQMDIATKALDRELQAAEMSEASRSAAEKIKADLAKIVMQLRTQRDLAGMRNTQGAPQTSKPPTEPPGRAPAGQAYQR